MAGTPLLFSLKPWYADLIFDGTKKAELRRKIASGVEGRDAFVYVSSPTMALRGGFRIGRVWRGCPEAVWRTVRHVVSVDKGAFDSYYAGQQIACAIEITDVWEYMNTIGLHTLRSRFEDFVAPQSWRYIRPEERRSFGRMKRRDRVESGGSPRSPQGRVATERLVDRQSLTFG